ncbi:MAG TPA: ABC transporter ATP-binding protein [Candidatus Binataceae bacterium]|nr:ABC transporter ATP-binding protein [Candidatus Binataceae bacterium]
MSPLADEIALRASGLVASYDPHPAAPPVLNNVALEVRAGELLAIVGPNGAGKSTLLRVLSGALEPRAGLVELFGRPLKSYDRRAIARTLASVAQENSVAFQFSVTEIVLMGRAPHLGPFHLESPGDVAIARAAMARFDLSGLGSRSIQELSGGERKRVFLARALAQEPRVILLDEPTAFLDLRHVAEIFECFRQLRAERRLAVVATLHDLNAAALYADRILMLKGGVTVGYGMPEEVFDPVRLREVYEVEVHVGRSPVSGALVVYPAVAATARPPA